MKVIFLDIDGVLNSQDWYKRRERYPAPRTMDQYHEKEFDPEAVKLLQRIIKKTGAKIVLSSTWRLHEENVEAVKKFAGIDIMYTTPRMPRPSGTSVEYYERGKEIQAWLDEWNKHCYPNPAKPTANGYIANENITRYVIIDDDTDMLPEQAEQFFNTDNRFGLTEPIAKEIIWYLNKK